MPSPVSVARQCLAEEAASALDEAVSVAKRRSHSQTTSLHLISALLSSTIRDACSRARTSACSPRLQFRALELCVGVALDRLSAAKSSSDEPPPVSNSLMAAIKRSQANQRRHPETFHMYQRQAAANSDSIITSISAVKVELKHLVLSILDDPVVSRVFADAGFRTSDLKWAVINPILTSRAFDKDIVVPNFPYNLGDQISNTTTTRIGQVLLMKERRNPLLIGSSAHEALRSFIDSLNRNEATGLVPEERFTVVSFKQELVNGEVESKLNQLSAMLPISGGRPGIIVDSGDLKSLLDVDSVDIANCVVSGLRRLLIDFAGKLWVIGSLASDQLYNRLVERFPTIERDWDLHLVPITSSTAGKQFKSSLMGSFVPFGGFFTTPSELNSLHATSTKSSSLCKSCNEKYELEVSTTVKDTATGLNASHHSINLPSWLSSSECETSKKSDGIEARKHDAVLDARVRALHRKWSDICQRLHSSRIYGKDIRNPKSQIFGVASFHSIPTSKNSADVGLIINRSKITDSNPCIPKPKISGPVLVEEVKNVLAEEPLHGVCSTNGNEPSASQQELIVPIAYTSSSSVTTDLGLGTFYASSEVCKSSKTLESTSVQFANKHVYMKDLKYPWKVLAEKVYWQIDAIRTISRTVSCHRSLKNGNVWLSFLGPDKAGKKKIAAGMAEIVFGGKQNLFSLDLTSQDRNHPSTSISCYDLKYERLNSGRKMIVDHLAEELSKRPNSVVLLENIEQADVFVQNSLSQAIKTGKFPNSYGRDINVNNFIFALMSASLKVGRDPPRSRTACEFTEENILEAKNVQMQILRSLEGNINSNSAATFSVMCSKIVSVNKRKLIGCESSNAEILKRSRSMIDLNLPVDNMEEEYSDAENCDSNNNSSQSSGKMLEEFLENVDENVVFQPFDFDTLSRQILNEIDMQLKRVVGTNKVLLEIDREVMLQILAAAWLTDRSDTLQDWIENVLCSTIKECLQMCNVASGVVLQLLPLNGTVVEELACGLCLPSSIIIN